MMHTFGTPLGPPYDDPQVDGLIHTALHEDLAYVGDLTCQCLVDHHAILRGRMLAKAEGVLCGVPLFARVLRHLEGTVEVNELCADGDEVEAGTEILRFQGAAAAILMAERTALNLIQSLSAVATRSRQLSQMIRHTRCRVYDTRKTIPGLRRLQKYAVTCGGGANHRIGLYDAVLIKENHIALMGADVRVGAAEAVARCRTRLGADALIQVEIADLDQLPGVIAAGADMVLCDNMSPELLRRAVIIRDELGCAPHAPQAGRRTVALEASGGITEESLVAVAESGVERVSIGALTHSLRALDISLLCEPSR